jgi:hypothetical protein
MGATHFLMKTLPRVASEMALHVLAYNLTRVMNIMGIQPLMAADQGIVGPKNAGVTCEGHQNLQSAQSVFAWPRPIYDIGLIEISQRKSIDRSFAKAWYHPSLA